MGRHKDFRQPRRRGFDDDVFPPPDFSPPPRPRPSFGGPRSDAGPADGPTIGAVVKWFNGQKGFGFVELSDGSGDAFLHIATLQAAGRETVQPGATLKVQTSQGPKGKQVARVLEVDESTAQPAPRRDLGRDTGRGPPRAGRFTADPATAVELSGTVKWFNPEKGFGFAAVGDGGKDVFIHISVLERSGLTTLDQGQRVTMRVVDTPKGREATSIAATP